MYLHNDNLSEWMVKQGHAWAYREYLVDTTFCTWEAGARARGWGLWAPAQAPQYAPWEWRAEKRGQLNGFTDYRGETIANCLAAVGKHSSQTLATIVPIPSQEMPKPPSDCPIKGNISKNGRIYHVPGSPSYESTEIDESKGERWFCTEGDARAAGWRAPRG